jgi:hypothetical protein
MLKGSFQCVPRTSCAAASFSEDEENEEPEAPASAPASANEEKFPALEDAVETAMVSWSNWTKSLKEICWTYVK